MKINQNAVYPASNSVKTVWVAGLGWTVRGSAATFASVSRSAPPQSDTIESARDTVGYYRVRIRSYQFLQETVAAREYD